MWSQIKTLITFKGRSNLKVITTNFRLPFGGVVLLVCQIKEHSCLQNEVSSKFYPNLGPKNLLVMRKIIKYDG